MAKKKAVNDAKRNTINLVPAGTHTARSAGTRWRAVAVITSRWPRVANVSWCHAWSWSGSVTSWRNVTG